MGKRKYIEPVTPFAKLREEYNETHDKYLSQSDMGEMANVTRSTISRIENGQQTPPSSVIEAYSKTFKVSTDYLTPTEQPIKTIPEDATPVREIGITEEVISTCKNIDAISNHNENIRAILNSLIGNGTDTVCLLQNILSYLANQELGNLNKLNEEIFLDNILNYVNGIMKPQLQKVIKHNIDWQNKFDENVFLPDK